MKAFFRNVLSSCLGTLLALSIIALVGFIMIRIYFSDSSQNQSGILHIPLSGLISDYSSSNIDFSSLSFSASKFNLWDLKNTINAASSDDEISGIFFEFENVQLSQQMTAELSGVLENFRSKGKKIFSYSSYFSQNAYLLSSFTDSIFLNPNGGVSLKGYGVYSPFFKSILDKYEIDVNVFYAGKYKSTTEPYRMMSFSDENEQQLSRYVGTLYDFLVENIAQNRKIDKERVREIISAHKIYDSNFMKANVIVDDLMYRDEVISFLEEYFDNKHLVEYENYEARITRKDKEVAIVFASGEIAWNTSAESSITPSSYEKIFQEIRENDNIKKIILRLDSPGGNGYASDLIHREVELTKAKGKKVYASLGSYATSGAYYIASACDSIFATPNTLTGSIGVYLMIPTVNKFLSNYLQINVDTIQSNSNAIAYTPLLGLSETQQHALEEQTQGLYELFLQKVANGRNMRIKEVQEIAQGRLWTGVDALSVGLVDKLMSFNDIERKLCNGRPEFVYPKQNTSLPRQILENSTSKFAFNENYEIKLLNRKLLEIQKLIEKPAPLMRIPHTFNVTNQ